MDAAFSNAFSPSRGHRVLGLNLKPLTVGHLLLLESTGLSITEPTTFQDISFLVFVCSQESSKADRSLSSWWAPILFRAWGSLWRNRDLKDQAEAWESYINEQLMAPQIKTPVACPRFETPLGVRLMVMLMRELGMSAQQAKDTTVAVANCLWVTVGEMEGTVNLWTRRDQDFWDACQELDRKELHGTA